MQHPTLPLSSDHAEMHLSPDMLPELDRVRQRAEELNMPLESALKQAFLIYLKDGPLAVVRAHGGEDKLQSS